MADLKFPLHYDYSRHIIHVDMDAFYASIEMRDHPEWQGKPVVIAKHPKENYGHGVVATANYEARKYGIHSAMSASEAYKKCPHAIFCPGNRDYYRQVSKQVHTIFRRYTDVIEPVALDEAYLDVTDHPKSPLTIAREIQVAVYEELHLTCSAGVSYNKFLAKIASDYRKPAGITVILPSQAQSFLKTLPIEKFKGIGQKTLPIMQEMGVETGGDLLAYSEFELIQKFGKRGYDLYRKVRGIHDEPVRASRPRKSVGREHTYHPALQTFEQLAEALKKDSEDVAAQLKERHLVGKTVVLKWRYVNFETRSRQMQLDEATHQAEVIYQKALAIWEDIDDYKDGLRLVGVTVTQLEENDLEQLKLF